jgi:hypothetical protein
MCYSVESSFGSFSLTVFVSIILWTKGSNIHKTVAIILFFISLMQALEGFIWLHLDDLEINKTITSFIPVLLYFQPIVILGTILYFNTGLLSSNVYKSLLAIWILATPFYIASMKNAKNQPTRIGPKGHLAWPYANTEWKSSLIQHLYYSLLFLGFATLNTKWYGIFYAFLALVTYRITRNIYEHSWGSVWCHSVNTLSVSSLFI